MTPAERVLERYKLAADQPPSHLVAILRRSISGGGHFEYKHYPTTDTPHLFTLKADTHFSVGMSDLKVLLRNGLMRIQVNDPGKITLYFVDEHDDEERHDRPNDMKGRG